MENGLTLALKFKFTQRLITNVLYNEAEENKHYLVHWIKEENFEHYLNKEFLYKGLDGITDNKKSEEKLPNSIICIANHSELTKAGDLFTYPIPPWELSFLEKHSAEKISSLSQYIENQKPQIQKLNMKLCIRVQNKIYRMLNLMRKIT